MDTDIADMVRSSLDSVWSLALLLLLHSDRDRTWSSPDLVRELRSSALVVKQSLATLQAAGLIVSEDGGRIRYAPSSPELDVLVARLEAEYRARPAAIRRMIVMPAEGKLKIFSDAFMFRKPPADE